MSEWITLANEDDSILRAKSAHDVYSVCICPAGSSWHSWNFKNRDLAEAFLRDLAKAWGLTMERVGHMSRGGEP